MTRLIAKSSVFFLTVGIAGALGLATCPHSSLFGLF